MKLREYQTEAVQDALAFISEVEGQYELDPAARRRLYVAPTGSGKGTIELALQIEIAALGKSCWILTPRREIVRGFLERLGVNIDVGGEKLFAIAEQFCISTPTRFQNRILSGDQVIPDVIIYDEGHHATEKGLVSSTLFALGPFSVWLGFTATAFRGSPRGTKQLEEDWNNYCVELISWQDAIASGYVSAPDVTTRPLIDDDHVKVVNGEFQVKNLNTFYESRLEHLGQLITEHYRERPTMVAVPSTEIAKALTAHTKGVLVLQDTSTRDREAAFRACQERQAALIQISVVSEGVDLPWLRVLIDASPTMSPVAWMQRVGRITRPVEPGESPPLYVSCCRNLERHAYLLEGVLPPAAVVEAQQAFEGPSKRMAARYLGLEALGRFKAIPIPLANGGTALSYNLWQMEDVIDNNRVVRRKVQYFVMSLPGRAHALCARRFTICRPDGTYANGRWQSSLLPPDFSGFATSKATGVLSDKQKQKWLQLADRLGLDADAADGLKRRQVEALFVLLDLRVKVA